MALQTASMKKIDDPRRFLLEDSRRFIVDIIHKFDADVQIIKQEKHQRHAQPLKPVSMKFER